MDDELESWIYLDGPEPEPVRQMLDLLRELPPATAEDVARMERTYFARFSGTAVTMGGTPPNPPARPVTMGGDRQTPLSQPVTMGGAPPSLPAPPPPARPDDVPPPPYVRPFELAQPDPAGAEPPSTHAPSAFASTSLDLKLPLPEARGKLPFVPPQDLSPAQRAPLTRQSPAYRPPGLGETAPLGDDSMTRARAALPFVSGSAFTLGGLTLEQYTSLRAELSIWPEREAQILEKYRVTARAALDDLWQLHLAHNPERREAFEGSLAEFTAYLRWLDAWTRPGRT